MENKKKRNLKSVIIWAAVIIIVPIVFQFLTGGIGSHDVEDISRKIEEHLYEKYGEEFIVDRIGLRSSRGQDFYQARIYPKSIIGTNKEWDDYYYGIASLDKKRFGLGGVADTYGEINRSLEIEDNLLPKAKELFGERVLLKVDQRYEKKNERGNFICYLSPGYEEIKEKMREEPEKHRILLDLQVYIFDRIENEEEKEVRREEIFDFVQYLKEEGLFEYLELGVIFIDERVLAPGYSDFRQEIARSSKVREKVDGEEVYLSPRSLRKKMSRQLQEEIDEMSEEELLVSMREIRKSDLSYDGIREYHGQYQSWIYSIGMLEQNYKSSITEEDKNRNYDNLKDIDIDIYRKYIYIN